MENTVQQPEKKRVRRLFIAEHLLIPGRSIENGAVLCQDDRILAVGGVSAFTREKELEIIEFPNAYLTPGFIDTHIHGAGGFDCSSVDVSPRPLDSMSRILGERGVTAFLPTVVASTPKAMLENLARLVCEIRKPMPGAIPLGINVEGPFLNPVKRGAQAAECIVPVDLAFARDLLQAGDGLVRIMTFAPELANARKLVELLCENKVIPSMGHSIANEAETRAAIDAGACHCTHLFNGMQPLHQRDIGLAGVALADERVTIELIIDGRHVDPLMVDLACRCKPLSQLIGISDCTMAAGMPNGEYRIGPSPILVRDGFSQTDQSVLAGTTTMLDTGWHSLISSGHLLETRAAMAVTSNPAQAFGWFDRGELLPNRRADLAIFENETNRPLMTVCGGKIIYRV